MFNKRVTIFTGHFGSGKTEVSVNYANQLALSGKKVAIVDLDIVNPFFRTADVKNMLEAKGIRVVTPVYANTNVDVPALPAEISTLFDDKSYNVVLDVGGDDLGARVLSRYYDEIVEDDYLHCFVINIKRPMTKTVDEIETMIAEIQGSSKMKIDILVNNSNLLGATTPDVIGEASLIVKEVSKRVSVPYELICGMKDVLRSYEGDSGIKRLYMEKFIRLPWEVQEDV